MKIACEVYTHFRRLLKAHYVCLKLRHVVTLLGAVYYLFTYLLTPKSTTSVAILLPHTESNFSKSKFKTTKRRKRTYVRLVDVEYGGTQCAADVAFAFVRIMKESHFQRNQSVRTEINSLHHLVRGPIPHVQMTAVMTCILYTKALTTTDELFLP